MSVVMSCQVLLVTNSPKIIISYYPKICLWQNPKFGGGKLNSRKTHPSIKSLLLANNKFASSNLYFEKKKPTYFAPILAHHIIIICGINYQNMEKLVGRYIVAMKRGFLIYNLHWRCDG